MSRALSKETVTLLINQVLNESCEEEGSVAQLIETSLLQRDTRISNLEGKINGLESDNADIKQELVRVNAVNADIKQELVRVNVYIRNLERLSDDQAQYSRKINIIMDGLNIRRGDNDNTIREMVLKEFRRSKLPIEDYDVDRAHRIESAYKDSGGKWHVPVIVRFTSWHARNIVYEGRKSLNAYVRADLTSRRKALLNSMKYQISVPDSRACDFIAFGYSDRNCNISVKTKDGRFFKVNSMIEFESLLNFVEASQPPNLQAWKSFDQGKRKEIESLIVNLNDVEDIDEWLKDEDHIYVGRQHGNIKGSPWGNPYKLKEHDVETSLRLYEEHVTGDDHLSNSLGDLHKKNLGCWCPNPAECHSSVLLKLLGTPVITTW